MITVKVTYKVKPEYSEENKKNIEAFLKDFKHMDSTTFRYSVFVLDDDTTFVHLSSYINEEAQKNVLNVASFLDFQKKRDESGLDGSHKVEIMNLLGSSFPII